MDTSGKLINPQDRSPRVIKDTVSIDIADPLYFHGKAKENKSKRCEQQVLIYLTHQTRQHHLYQPPDV